MILEEETFKKFGYYSTELTPKSNKNIIAKCDNCGKVRILKKCGYSSLCLQCGCWSEERRKKLSKAHSGDKNANWNGGKIKRRCIVCKKEFEVIKTVIRKGHGLFCSRSCLGKYRNGEKSPNWKGGKITYICVVCGKEFEDYENANRKTCSNLCSRKKQKIPTHHTQPELIFDAICKKHNMPFHYVGDGSLWIGKEHPLNPDFIEANGEKIIVEIFGDYWHSPLLNYQLREDATLDYRKKHYKKYGWKSYFLWESDLKRPDAEQFILKQIEKIF